jgi:hypothetical protein
MIINCNNHWIGYCRWTTFQTISDISWSCLDLWFMSPTKRNSDKGGFSDRSPNAMLMTSDREGVIGWSPNVILLTGCNLLLMPYFRDPYLYQLLMRYHSVGPSVNRRSFVTKLLTYYTTIQWITIPFFLAQLLYLQFISCQYREKV